MQGTLLVSESKEYAAEELLYSGHRVRIRAIEPSDKNLVQEVVRHLSPQSRFFRFFTVKDRLSERELEAFTELDFKTHVGLIANIYQNGTFVPAATARYIICRDRHDKSAEISFDVEEEFQGLGIGSALLKHLTVIARQQKIEHFIAYVMVENERMLSVFEHSGLAMTQSNGDQGIIEVSLKI